MAAASADAAREMSYVDLHFHLLPGVDDGPGDMDASLELAQAAVAEGTGTVVATPHVRADARYHRPGRDPRSRAGAARARSAPPAIPLEVRCGGELDHELVGRMRQSELELIAQGPTGARWLLVETPFQGSARDFHEATAELRDRGFGVLVAHPERSADASLDGAAGLGASSAAGSLAQLNALSLTGDHGEEACSAAWELVAEGLVAVVASDAHGPTRPPALALARRTLLEVGISRSTAESADRLGTAPPLATGIASRRPVAA